MTETVDRIDTWSQRWKDRRTGFHMNCVHPSLLKWYDTWLPEKHRPYTILVPLCGKSHDLKWLYNQGHTVIGVEAVEDAIKQFFDEHKMPHTVTAVENSDVNVYQSSDGRLCIYCADLFSVDLALLLPCNAVWDRGSLVAIFQQDRASYGDLMAHLATEHADGEAGGVRYLLEAMEYDTTAFSGPPRHMPLDTIQAVLGRIGNIQQLDTERCTADCDGDTSERMRQQMSRWNLRELTRRVYLISR